MNKRFLVIEDDRGCEKILTRVLQSVDPKAEVDWEESAEQALVALKKNRALGHPYDLIVADIFLSGKQTGLEFWEKFKDQFSDAPVLFVSSLPMDRFFDAIGKNSIAPAFLAKPFHIGEAKQIIAGLLSYH